MFENQLFRSTAILGSHTKKRAISPRFLIKGPKRKNKIISAELYCRQHLGEAVSNWEVQRIDCFIFVFLLIHSRRQRVKTYKYSLCVSKKEDRKNLWLFWASLTESSLKEGFSSKDLMWHLAPLPSLFTLELLWKEHPILRTVMDITVKQKY